MTAADWFGFIAHVAYSNHIKTSAVGAGHNNIIIPIYP